MPKPELSAEEWKAVVGDDYDPGPELATARRLMAAGDGTGAAKIALAVYKREPSEEAKDILEELFHGSAQGAAESESKSAAAAAEAEVASWLWAGVGLVGSGAVAMGALERVEWVPPSTCISLVPLYGFGCYAVTLYICCGIHARYARYQLGVSIPVISELGMQQPGTIVYQVGG